MEDLDACMIDCLVLIVINERKPRGRIVLFASVCAKLEDSRASCHSLSIQSSHTVCNDVQTTDAIVLEPILILAITRASCRFLIVYARSTVS